ncbi:MAG: isoleucine--tRNA ligase, partial [Bacteroidetes bacterium]|nr:isoleucine--tRNA ligase [Bacteroidota bacterium]
MKYNEYKKLDLPKIAEEMLKLWKEEETFEKSVSNREGAKDYVFYEGPPSANGLPGIHHVMARSIKDIFCRYKTLKGFRVERKAGWDTHGLPIELSVEKTLGITKEDIGKKISIEDYNKACRKEVMKYTGIWNDLTEKMGYWVNMDDPYITYENKYIESVWNLLSEFYKKGLLYKGFTIQPYSPAAGTGLSTHELNQPGCYRTVKDTTVVAQFQLKRNEKSDFLYQDLGPEDIYFIAWTTTPWTLPSNTALAVGKNIDYLLVKTFNQYTGSPINIILAKKLFYKYFNEKNAELKLEDYKPGDKEIPYRTIAQFKGSELEGIRYEQLFPYAQPKDGDAFRVLLGDFVTTDDGTGIVHLAPSFGSDDFRVAKQNGIGSLTLVDLQGRFTAEVTDFAGEHVKEEYIEPDKFNTEFKPVDVKIAIKLKEENRAFKVEKYEHSYPHCWRTDKPVLYYPLDSWFVKTTEVKSRMMELNNTINWKPESTGTGRFGNWLENLVDWNLSRSRYWGIPIPIWTSEDRTEQICIGSAEQLKSEIAKSIEAGYMDKNHLENFKAGDFSKENYETFDLHRPYVDDIVLVSPTGKKMIREADLIDVWFDSGAMPYAQWHYPFENKEKFNTT